MGKATEYTRVAVDKLIPYVNNAKQHSDSQVTKIASSIREFGFLNPVLIDASYNVIAGHGRILAAKKLGMAEVPCLFVEGLTDAQRKAYILADNRLAELAEWDEDLVRLELDALADAGLDTNLTGFDDLDLEDSEEEDGAEGSVNLTQTLPESKVYIFSVSAFGTDSEKILVAKIPQATADHILEAIRDKDADVITATLLEAVNGL